MDASIQTSSTRRAPIAGRAIALLLAAILLIFSVGASADDTSAAPAEIGETPIFSVGGLRYRPGRGLRIGDTGFVLGGFANIKAETTDESGGEFSFDALDIILIFDRFERFRAVADLELKDIFTADEDRSGTQDFAFNVRRLFGDFSVNDQLRLRFGTFLTPIGHWNLILAPPLTWTTEAPLIVEETFFEKTTTGAMIHGSAPAAEGRVEYSVFSQFLDPLEDDPDLMPPDTSVGLRVSYGVAPSWSVGLSYQSAELDGRWSHLGGAHALWQLERGEILAEAYYQDGQALQSDQWGTFLQGALEIVDPFYLVGRYEHYDPPEQQAVDVFTVGGLCRPLPFMAIKVEYRFADEKFDDEDLDGFFASFSTFF